MGYRGAGNPGSGDRTPAVQPIAGLARAWDALGWGSQWARRPVRGSAARSHMGVPLEDTYQVTRTGLPPLMLSLPSDVRVLRWGVQLLSRSTSSTGSDGAFI